MTNDQIEAPVVKPLEWRATTSPREDGPAEETGEFEAVSPIGTYQVLLTTDEDVAETPFCAWTPEESLGHFGSPEEAQAAAQADYEQRIRSALLPSSPDQVKRETIEACARVVEERAKEAESTRRLALVGIAEALRLAATAIRSLKG